MTPQYPRTVRGLSARRGLLTLALLLSSLAATLAYIPFGLTGAQDNNEQQDTKATSAVVVPGSGLEQFDPRPRHTLSAEGDARTAKEETDAPTRGEVMSAADVTWRAADGTRVISGTYTIPAGTTVTVEPGVRIQINQNSTLLVEGALVGRGTADRRIVITGAADGTSFISVPGRFDIDYADISARNDPRSGSTYICSNTRFTGSSSFFMSLGYSFTMPAYVELRHATFDGVNSSISLDNTTAVLRDVAFTGGAAGRIFYSYVFLDNVRSDNAAGHGLQFRLDGRWYLNNLQVRNASGAALDLGGGNRGGDYHLGENVTLAGSRYPVSLEWAGLLPGSTLPASGNTNNYIVADTPANPDWRGPFTWAPQSIPYVILSGINLRGGGEWRMLPGVNVKFGPGFTGITDESLGLIARGTPAAPVLFDRFDPAQAWGGIGNTTGGNRYAHLRLEGSQNGISTTVHNGAFAYVEDLILSNNERGAGGGAFVTGTRFLNNATGYQETGTGSHTVGVLNADPASPNSFEGNGVAVRGTGSIIEARGNWWNSPTGPRHASNPNGTGEVIEGGAEFIPFLTARPDYTDTPPVVRQHKPHFTYEAGTKIDITWDAEDDRNIVSHRILFNPDGNYPVGFRTIAEGLPGSVRAYEWTVPAVGYAGGYGYSTVRVVAVDSAGHERFDDRFIQIPSGQLTGTIRITSNLAGQTLRPGQRIDVNFVAEGDARYEVVDAYLLLDNDAYTVSLGGVAGSLGQLSAKIPYVSTDRARLVFRINGGRNRTKWFYGDFFSIRPDPRVGDAAPTVSVVSPSNGAAFPAGSTVRVGWSAFDDEAISSYRVLASYDAGRSWNLIAEDLPAGVNFYDFKTAAGAGFSDVRVRVVACDRRFQQSSAEVSFALTSTPPPNAPPSVRLERPTADSTYVAGVTLTLTAAASDADGAVSKVEFFAGSTLVGTDTAAPYEVAWQNVPAGTHAVVARATDNVGAQKDSLTVNVHVHAAPPQPAAVAGAAWGARYNGPSNGADYAPTMTLDASGNVYVTAASDGIGSDQDIVTVKYDAAGRQLWAARYGNPDNRVEYPEDIGVDSAGNVYVIGTAWRGLDVDGGTGYDFITIKYDAAGNQQWVRFSTGTSDEYGVALEPDAAGNLYITGSAAGQFATLKYDPAGNVLWTRNYSGPQSRGAAPVDLELDANGNIFVGGVINVTRTNGATDEDLAVVKYDASGTLLRAAQYDTPGTNGQDFDTAVRLRVGAGGVYMIAQSWPDQCCEVTESRYDSLLLKFDTELALQWAARWGLPGQTTEKPRDLVIDSSGNVYVVGTSGSPERAGDAFTLKYSAAGQLLWQRVYEGLTYQYADAAGVVLDPAGGVHVAVEALGPADNYDYTLVRYLADGTQGGVRQFNGPANRDDTPTDIEADAAGNVYLTGFTFTNTSRSDLFTLKVSPAGAPTPTPTPTPVTTPTPTPNGPVNVALAANGGVAIASSTYDSRFPVTAVNNGDRRGMNWGSGGGWNDATGDAYPDWIEIAFNGSKTINEVDLFTVQDNFASPSEPTEAQTFSLYGVTGLRVEQWTGSVWELIPGAQLASTNRVWNKFTFAPVTTTKIRVLVNSAMNGHSRLVEVEAWQGATTPAPTPTPTPTPTTGRVNVALASNGATAAASTSHGSNFPAAATINGDRRGMNWGNGGGWNDATGDAYPDWVEVSFAGAKTIDEVDVFTLQDAYAAPSEPTESQTFTLYGVTSFQVQYLTGGVWTPLPGGVGAVTGNNKVWRKITFAPVTTTKIRVLVNNALNSSSRLVEVEAWQVSEATQRTNHALASNGAVASASSVYGSNFPVVSVNNGDRRGMNWGSGGGWNDATGDAYPDWIEIAFNGSKTINEVDLFTVQDNFASPSEPTEALTFTKYGVTQFDVQTWDGERWLNVPGASVVGNNLVWRKVTFAPVTTTKIRVLVRNALNGHSRLAEVEAY